MGRINFSDDDGDLRKCNKCSLWKPRTRQFFVGSKACRYGLTGTCKTCINEFHRVYRKGNEKLAVRRRQLYRASEKVVEKARERRRWRENPHRMRALVLREGMKLRARQKNLQFDSEVFTKNRIIMWLIDQPDCQCCGHEFQLIPNAGMWSNASPSMDRIDTSLGYVAGNVALICWRCNNLKRDATADELECVVRWLRGGCRSQFAPTMLEAPGAVP